jgi:hypothetical protein
MVNHKENEEVFVKKIFALISLVLVAAAFAGADVYVKTKTHTDAISIMGQNQPARDETTEQWFGDDKFALISPEMSSIMDLKKNVMYLINPKEKTYVEAPLPLDMTKLFPPEMAQMLSQMMKMTVSVTSNGQTKTIGQWPCSGYDVSIQMPMMPMKMSVWASTDVPIDMPRFMRIQANVLKAQLHLDDAAVQEMMKVKGYWIASETTAEVMGSKIRNTSEVIEIAKKTPDSSVYAVPAGFKKQETLSMQDFQRR